MLREPEHLIFSVVISNRKIPEQHCTVYSTAGNYQFKYSYHEFAVAAGDSFPTTFHFAPQLLHTAVLHYELRQYVHCGYYVLQYRYGIPMRTQLNCMCCTRVLIFQHGIFIYMESSLMKRAHVKFN